MSIKQSFNFLLRCADNDNITGGPLENYPLYSQGDKGKGGCFPYDFCP